MFRIRIVTKNHNPNPNISKINQESEAQKSQSTNQILTTGVSGYIFLVLDGDPDT